VIPMLNIAVIANFFPRGICSFHNIGIGKIMTTTSISKLKIPADRKALVVSAHFPSMVLSQVYANGRHNKKASRNTTKQ